MAQEQGIKIVGLYIRTAVLDGLDVMGWSKEEVQVYLEAYF